MKKNTQIWILTLLAFSIKISAQIDTTHSNIDNVSEDIIESFILNTEAEGDFDFIDLSEELEQLLRRPIDLNSADFEALDFGILSPIQIQSFLDYRAKAGNLLSIYELQAVPDFSIETIKSILPFVKTTSNPAIKKLNFRNLLAESNSELMARWTRLLETPAGFTSERDGSKYLGDPNQLFIRYKMTAGEIFRVGFTLEKDRGEEFFKGSNKHGFDFNSFHLYAKDLSPAINHLVLGDFSASFGQGLILQNGFARGKNAEVLNVKRRNQPIKPYSSINEAAFFRGAAANFQLSKNLDLTVLGSFREIDGNITVDTFATDQFEIVFSSFLESGMHRTVSEIESENSVEQITTAGRLNYKTRKFQIAFNSVFDKLNKPLKGIEAPYNLYRFSGEELFNGSLDFSYYYKNLHFFGEIAADGDFARAGSAGLLMGLGKYASASFLYRDFDAQFQNLHGQPLSETRSTQNEQGFYSCISFTPSRHWKIDAYYDFWKHPWLRFATDAPSAGNEWLLKVQYKIRKKLEAYVQWRGEIKEVNSTDNETKVDFLTPRHRQYLRANWKYQFSKFLEWRNRIEVSRVEKDDVIDNGFLAYQDIIWKLPEQGIQFKTRLAYYSTDDYDSRIYTFENDVLNSFSIPAFYGTGTRFYFYCRYKLLRSLNIEGRYARTFREGEDGIGSGGELIDGNSRNELKFQIKWKF